MREVRDMEEFAASQNAIEEIYAERRRQVDSEGWTPEHDDDHRNGELADAAACYALSDTGGSIGGLWPWDLSWFKPRDRRRDLIRAAALIVAEIERLDRLPPPPHTRATGDAK